MVFIKTTFINYSICNNVVKLSYGDDPQRHSSSAGDHLDIHHNGPSSASSSSSLSNNNNNNNSSSAHNNNNKPSGPPGSASSLTMSFSSEQIACVCEALQQAGDMEVISTKILFSYN